MQILKVEGLHVKLFRKFAINNNLLTREEAENFPSDNYRFTFTNLSSADEYFEDISKGSLEFKYNEIPNFFYACVQDLIKNLDVSPYLIGLNIGIDFKGDSLDDLTYLQVEDGHIICFKTYYACRHNFDVRFEVQISESEVSRSPMQLILEGKKNASDFGDLGEKFYIKLVNNQAEQLEHIENQTEAICLAAVKRWGWALQCVKKQTPEICLAAVKQSGTSINFVKEFTPEICEVAVKEYGKGLKYIPENLQTPKLCILAIKNDPEAIKYVKNPTEEMYIMAAKNRAQFHNFKNTYNSQTEDTHKADLQQKKTGNYTAFFNY